MAVARLARVDHVRSGMTGGGVPQRRFRETVALPCIVAKEQPGRGNEQADHDGRRRRARDIVGFLPSHGYRHGGRAWTSVQGSGGRDVNRVGYRGGHRGDVPIDDGSSGQRCGFEKFVAVEGVPLRVVE